MALASPITTVTQADDGRLVATFADGGSAEIQLAAVLQTANPLAPVLHRSALTAADGTTKPAANNANWLANPGGRTKARVFVSATGTPTAASLRAYLRCGGTSGQVATTPVQNLNGAPNYDQAWDCQTDGDDLLVFVESLTGGTSPSVSIWVGWR